MNRHYVTAATARRTLTAVLPAILLLQAAAAAPARAQAADWCSARDVGRNQYCEIRQHRFTMDGGTLDIDVGANGSIEVESYRGSEVRVTARVMARGLTAGQAREQGESVQLRATPGQVRATGPRTSVTRNWTVSVRIQLPEGVAVNARTTNGTITIAGNRAPVQARTTNGAIRVADAAGRLDIRSTNGTIRASLAAAGQPLESIQLRTTNGGVTLTIPDGTSARLELSTTNGGITTDMPLTVQGRINRRQVSAVLGNGGPEIRVSTTNGAIRVGHP
jgi:opacity protein-like surface antigen